MADEKCTTDGCPGDWRYPAPGRGHLEHCHYPILVQYTNWKAKYEALRDGVTGLCDDADRNHEEYLRGVILDRFIVPANVTVSDLRAVVARVEENNA